MNYISVIMAIFSMIGAFDLLIGNKFGIGAEFEKGFKLFGTMALSMIGMIVLAQVIGDVLQPASNLLYKYLHIDPSMASAIFFSNDMGGAPLCGALAKSSEMGKFNGLIVASMMGATVSFTLPLALGMVNKQQHKDMFQGFLCGIITIPIGCFASGLIIGLEITALLVNLIPLVIFSVIISLGLIYIPGICVKIFEVFGKIIKTVIIIGLALGILKFLVGVEIIKGLTPLEDGAMICLNASIVMTGAFPLMYIISKVVSKPLGKIGDKVEINEASAFGFFSTLATNITTFEAMEKMDRKGVVLNSAFAISAAFTFAGHLAFTMAYDSNYILPVIVGKLISGVVAIPIAAIMYNRTKKKGLN